MPAWNDLVSLAQTEPGSIPEAFHRRLRRHPDRRALLVVNRSVTYRGLGPTADAIARQLRAAGVRHGDLVGLYLPRGEQAIAAMLAVLQAGAAYVPFDPSYPAKLLRHIY